MSLFRKVPAVPLYLRTIVFLGVAMVFFSIKAASELESDYLTVGGGGAFYGSDAVNGIGFTIENGPVGIGTLTPQSQLHIVADPVVGTDGTIVADGMQADSITIKDLYGLAGGLVSINAEASFNATTTLNGTSTYLRVGSDGSAAVNLSDVFEEVITTQVEVWTETAYPLFSVLAPANHHDSHFLGILVEFGKKIGLSLNVVVGKFRSIRAVIPGQSGQ